MNSSTVRPRLTLPRKRAMTLVEILVVMFILIILVGVVVVVVMFCIPYKDPVIDTKGLLKNIVQGMEQYKAIYRMYPPQDTPVDSTQAVQVEASSSALWQEIEHYNHFVVVGAVHKLQGGTFTDSKTGTVQTSYCYMDAWQEPLRYICVSPYTRYTLTSGGPDLMMDTADDIVKRR